LEKLSILSILSKLSVSHNEYFSFFPEVAEEVVPVWAAFHAPKISEVPWIGFMGAQRKIKLTPT
jgi:hypothetical protein